jgi:hypothetical protein
MSKYPEMENDNNALIIRVVCYAGYKGEETPKHFYVGERKVVVVEIIDRWLSPDLSYFKVKGNDSDVYIIRYDIKSDHWEMTMYQAGIAK